MKNRFTNCDARKVRSKSGVLFRRGFTLVEILIVMGVIAVLGAIMVGVLRGRSEGARRSQCDMKVKAIALALDAFRQETGRYPQKLSGLRDKKYLDADDALRCPSDRRTNGSYEEYYVPRAPRDSSELPVLVCPFHEAGNHGQQAFVGRYTSQLATSPATLVSMRRAWIEHPDGKGEISAIAGMELRGGDRIRTDADGEAIIRFVDGSTATVGRNSNITVLQSFLDGQQSAPLYTLVRQTLGNVTYRIHTGSKFDVVTPTATAGARGTEFDISVDSQGNTKFTLKSGKAVLTTVKRTAWAPLGQPVNIVQGLLDLTGLPGLLPGLPLVPGLPGLPGLPG